MGFLDGTYDDDNLLELQEIVPYDGTNAQGRGSERHLSAVLPAISASLGVPVATAIHPHPEDIREKFGMPRAQSIIVVLIDGLGFWNMVERKGHAPYLRALLSHSGNDQPISTCFPSTTVSALSVFGTGTCPGLTAMTGYTQLNPDNGRLSQMIKFTDGLVPEDVQTQPTVFEGLSAQGVRVTTCGLGQFSKSALTRAALRGTRYISGRNAAQHILAAAKASYEPGLTYLYIRDADKMGHQYGWNDEHWIGTFERVDAQLRTLASKAAPGTLIVITADHGMINSNPEHRIDIAAHEHLQKGVHLIGGEPRAVSLYAHADEDPEDIAHRWSEFLGEQARVYTQEQAVHAGLYGPVSEHTQRYLADVIVMAAEDTTIVDSRTQSEVATHLPSVHGSLTKAEIDIPLFLDVVE
ncbi:alkaline phosphatase family protein [Alloscardovia criceti]|uniref:alkaline phosphatase family protein n=1 Tax=Alloscardovia criceti TaxID=356828 RepID=UPI0004767555|nr:alkaline phosphatase family protein [Alloscardovia criceti]